MKIYSRKHIGLGQFVLKFAHVLECDIINVFYRYEEFHPFLFCQHSQCPYIEFESFDKVGFPVLFFDQFINNAVSY